MRDSIWRVNLYPNDLHQSIESSDLCYGEDHLPIFLQTVCAFLDQFASFQEFFRRCRQIQFVPILGVFVHIHQTVHHPMQI